MFTFNFFLNYYSKQINKFSDWIIETIIDILMITFIGLIDYWFIIPINIYFLYYYNKLYDIKKFLKK